jgi:hypothetical protein
MSLTLNKTRAVRVDLLWCEVESAVLDEWQRFLFVSPSLPERLKKPLCESATESIGTLIHVVRQAG